MPCPQSDESRELHQLDLPGRSVSKVLDSPAPSGMLAILPPGGHVRKKEELIVAKVVSAGTGMP